MLEGLQIPQSRLNTCKVQLLSETLEPSDQKILLDACKNPEWSAKNLSRQLKERGIAVSDTTILRHRRKECNCK